MLASTFALFEEAHRAIEPGQARLVDAAGQVLASLAPAWHERLGPEQLSRFAEPLLFLHACNGGSRSMTLDQMLVGHTPASARPANLEVNADDAGIVFMPRLGDIRTGQADRRLALTWSGLELEPSGRDAGASWPCIPHALVARGIEVCSCGREIIAQALQRSDAPVDAAVQPGLAGRHLSGLRQAYALIAASQPGYARSIAAAVQRVALFESASLHSFTASACPGMVFLNVRGDGCGTAFFVEDLAHQCGHAVFSAWTSEPSHYLSLASQAPLHLLTGKVDERRTVYEAFHGIFTEAAMVACLGPCLAHLAQDDVQRLEALARLGFILRRFGTDLHDLSRIAMFTAAGERMLEAIIVVFKAGYDAYWDAVRGFDYANQGYAFDFRLFKAANGL